METVCEREDQKPVPTPHPPPKKKKRRCQKRKGDKIKLGGRDFCSASRRKRKKFHLRGGGKGENFQTEHGVMPDLTHWVNLLLPEVTLELQGHGVEQNPEQDGQNYVSLRRRVTGHS